MYSKTPAYKLMLNLLEKNKYVEIISADHFSYKYDNELIHINIFGLNQRKKSWVILCYDYLKTDNFISFTIHERGLMNNVNISENEKILNISYYGLFNFNIFKVNGLNVLKL